MTNAIDLSKLAPPDLLQQTDFETLLQEQIDQLAVIDPDYAASIRVGDPGYNVMLAVAYVRQLDRQRFNEAGRGVLLAYATGADLDQIGATRANLAREMIDAGDADTNPPVDPVYESDDVYRLKIALANEGLSTAGSRGAYRFHTLTAGRTVVKTTVVNNADGDVIITRQTEPTGLDEPIKDVAVLRPVPGVVEIVVMNYVGDGVPSVELLDAVDAALSDEDKRPLTDTVRVVGVDNVEYAVNATLYFLQGVDRSLVMAEAQSELESYVAKMHYLGKTVSEAGIKAALYRPGVDRLRLTTPATDLKVSGYQAAYCTDIQLLDGGE